MKVRNLMLVVASILLLLVLVFAQIQMLARDGGGPESGKVLLDVPFVRQKEWFCSEASASMVLAYYGYNLSQDQINELGYDRFENMLPLLSKYVRAEYSCLTIEDLKKEIDERNPVILRILLGRYLHTIVVVGYDSMYIYIHDPGDGPNLPVKPETLLSVWWPTNFNAIILEGRSSPRLFGEWYYYGTVISTEMVTGVSGEILNVKDPEFVRLPNHTLFRDAEGQFYVVLTAWTYIGVFRTKDILNYEFVGYLDLHGKVAPYCIYHPQERIFYLFYTDWRNTVTAERSEYGRLGLAVGEDIRNISSFKDKGYLDIRGNLLPDLSAGWDPYVFSVNGTYYMMFSAASHGVHIASSQSLGRTWTYISKIIDERRENPTLFYYDSKWYVMIGIYDADGYDLYNSNSFLNWTLLGKDWFKDPENPLLPAGSTSALINGTLYLLYQVSLDTDLVHGPFKINLASINLTENLTP